MLGQFTGELAPLACFIEWGIAFANYADKVLEVKESKDAIDALESQQDDYANRLKPLQRISNLITNAKLD